jgi:hypothetical protein
MALFPAVWAISWPFERAEPKNEERKFAIAASQV